MKSISIRSKSSFSSISRAICPFSAWVTDYSPANQEFVGNEEIDFIIFCDEYLLTLKPAESFQLPQHSETATPFSKIPNVREQT
jgi:hypothetical protein